jgi:hypothetical protein
MTFINSAVLAMIRRTADTGFLTDTCTIERPDEAVNSRGQMTSGWALVASDVRCRVVQGGRLNNPAVMDASLREAMDDLYRISVAYGTALERGYRMTLSTGNVFYVVRLETELSDDVFHSAIISRKRP